MAKVAFSKLSLKNNTDVKTFEWEGNTIEVKQYLPMEKKLNVIENVLWKSQDQQRFYNCAKIHYIFWMEVIEAYTNVNFTEKQRTTDGLKTYDLLEGSGFIEQVALLMDRSELNKMQNWCNQLVSDIITYNNSAYGLVQSITTDFKDLDLEADDIRQKLADGDGIEFLQEVIDKMG